MAPSRPIRVVVVRGHQANPWELRPWERLPETFAVTYLRSAANQFDTSAIALSPEPVSTLRARLPQGRLGDLAVRVPGDRYLGLERHLRGADIVHAQELGYWYAMQAARLKQRLGYKLVLTAWETLPFGDAYRNVRTRAYRRRTLAAADLFLPATERAARALRLEGVAPERMRVAGPGIDPARFVASAAPPSGPPTVLSAGRLVWEKGHQDVVRAFALARAQGRLPADARVLIVGDGPEAGRLRAHAADLGVSDAVEISPFVPYDAMPLVYAGATCLVLASLGIWSWEEQFGMVLMEAHAAGVPILASTSGAIPEVAGPTAAAFAPGDWPALADLIADHLADPPVHTVRDPERVAFYSVDAAAARLAAAYADLLA